MASANFQTTKNTRVLIGTEVTLGTAAVADCAAVAIPVTDYSFGEIGAGGQTLDVAPLRAGIGGQNLSDDMVKAKRHDRMYEVSLTFHCTDLAVKRVTKNLFEDGVASGIASLLGNMPTTSHYKHGAGNVHPVSIIIENAGHAGNDTDMVFFGAMCTNLSFSGSIDSDGGVVMCTATFVTGYLPTATTNLTYTVATTISDQQTVFNMHDLTTKTLNSQDLTLYGFELSISREVNRISFDSSSNFAPSGYSVGGYDVSGTLTSKRDDLSLAASVEGHAPVALDLDTGVYQILAPTCIIDTTSISFDEDGWKQSIPFKCAYTGATSSTIVSFAGTASDS